MSITPEDVDRKIGLANDELDDAWNTDLLDDGRRDRSVAAAQAQATLALTYATMLVAQNQPLGALGDVVQELRAIREELTSISNHIPWR